MHEPGTAQVTRRSVRKGTRNAEAFAQGHVAAAAWRFERWPFAIPLLGDAVVHVGWTAFALLSGARSLARAHSDPSDASSYACDRGPGRTRVFRPSLLLA